MHILLYLYGVPRFDSSVAFKLLTKYIMAKVKYPIFFMFEVYGMNLLLS